MAVEWDTPIFTDRLTPKQLRQIQEDDDRAVQELEDEDRRLKAERMKRDAESVTPAPAAASPATGKAS